ncbi:MAG TPA: hypothetical protein VHV75_09425 [Solirubrobacteraceae bacterium]|jgi:hypothetical protein|nr:hypothetical protein [Solirubrobacteraceae bacterium]
MTPRRSDHKPETDPPGAVSNQNQEQAESGHRDDGTHPEPRTTGKEPKKKGEEGEAAERPSGAAGEGSQSTGHPHNAG